MRSCARACSPDSAVWPKNLTRARRLARAYNRRAIQPLAFCVFVRCRILALVVIMGCAMANLLVVEDDPDSAEVLCRMLTRGGHRCSSVPNGKQAMAALLYELPDVLVLDLYMPEMSGIDLLGIVRSY